MVGVRQTLGLLLAASVTAASINDGAAAPDALDQLTAEWFPRLRLVWADQKYHNPKLYGWMAECAHYAMEIVHRPEGSKGFVLLPKRLVGSYGSCGPSSLDLITVIREGRRDGLSPCSRRVRRVVKQPLAQQAVEGGQRERRHDVAGQVATRDDTKPVDRVRDSLPLGIDARVGNQPAVGIDLSQHAGGEDLKLPGISHGFQGFGSGHSRRLASLGA